MITRRSVLVSSLLLSLGATALSNRKLLTGVAKVEYAFPIDVIREVLGPELLRVGDAPFRAAANRLAMREPLDIGTHWTEDAWQAALRADFEQGRVMTAYGFVLSYTESLAYAAEALQA